MIDWHFNPDYRDPEIERLFGNLKGTFSANGRVITTDKLSHVVVTNVGSKRFYVKRYKGNGRGIWHRWFGLRGLIAPQRVVGEWKNLLLFRSWGIPTASLVAYGLERQFGYFIRGALVTEEIRHTSDLATLARNGDQRLSDRQWVKCVSRQLALYARTMHSAGFAHNDFKWRNILVDSDDPPTVHLIDCPTGRFWWPMFLGYRIVKDLACLGKDAEGVLSRTQCLRFYLDYAGRDRLSSDDKKRVRQIVRYIKNWD